MNFNKIKKGKNRALIVLVVLFIRVNLAAQNESVLAANRCYFVEADSAYFSNEHIKKNNINKIAEYRNGKFYEDSVILSREYFFDSSGALIETRIFNGYDTTFVTKYRAPKNDEALDIMEEDYLKISPFKKPSYNPYSGQRFLKLIKDSGTEVELVYSTDNLVSTIQYFQPNGSKGSKISLTYDSLGRLITEVTTKPGDSIGSSSFYKYDLEGRRIYTEDKSHNWSRIEIIDYSKSKPNKLVERTFINGKLSWTVIIETNEQGFLTSYSYDAGKIIKRPRQKRRPSWACGYSPPRYWKYTYDYDLYGNLICEKRYNTPRNVTRQTNYVVDSQNRLVKKIIYEDSREPEEWRYVYN